MCVPLSRQLNCSFAIALLIACLRTRFHLPVPVRDVAIVFVLSLAGLFVVHVVVQCVVVCCCVCLLCCVRALCVCCVVCGVCACLLWLGGGVWVWTLGVWLCPWVQAPPLTSYPWA